MITSPLGSWLGLGNQPYHESLESQLTDKKSVLVQYCRYTLRHNALWLALHKTVSFLMDEWHTRQKSNFKKNFHTLDPHWKVSKTSLSKQVIFNHQVPKVLVIYIFLHWKTYSAVEPPSDFEFKSLGLIIKHPNY